MSRIHDALKKAAEERAWQPPASSAQTFAVVTEGNIRSAPAGNGLDTAPKNGSAKADKQTFLRFEQLLNRCAHPKWTLDPRMSVFGGTDSKKIGAEPFQTLRSRLSQIADTRLLKRVVITSSVAAEGKTFVAANLAQSIVRQPDRRVLLIDADLRASRLHLALGAPSTPGLTDYLRGEADDFVILDSPPATPVHDPSVFADLCDGVLFVVRAGVTDFEVAEKAVAEFREKNLLGVVLNAAGQETAYRQQY